MAPIRVAIADDHPVVREGLTRIVQRSPGFELVGTVENADAVLDLCKVERPDVLLLDISMPGPEVFETLRALRRETPDVRVLILSWHPEDQYALPCLEAGAAGYVTKQRRPEELLRAVTRVAEGQRFVSEAAASRLAGRLLGEEDVPVHQRLSPREFEIFLLLGEGLSVGQIATRLEISPKTVSTHRAHILEKTGLTSNADIIRYVVEKKLG